MNLKQILWNASWLTDQRRLELFPPLWLTRIRVLEMSDGWRTVRILLPQTWLSRNTGGTLFGGFQAAVADPIAAMACVRIFPDSSVWTRSLQLDFHTPGNTDLELRFHFPSELEEQIRDELNSKGRSTPTFEYGYYRTDGRRCTTIISSVAIRPRGYQKPTREQPD